MLTIDMRMVLTMHIGIPMRELICSLTSQCISLNKWLLFRRGCHCSKDTATLIGFWLKVIRWHEGPALWWNRSTTFDLDWWLKQSLSKRFIWFLCEVSSLPGLLHYRWTQCCGLGQSQSSVKAKKNWHMGSLVPTWTTQMRGYPFQSLLHKILVVGLPFDGLKVQAMFWETERLTIFSIGIPCSMTRQSVLLQT